MGDEKDVVRIGIIGAGFARSTQIPGFRACEGALVSCIASAHREHAESVAREFGIPNVADDWRELVSRDDVDLVSVVTPPVTHMEMTLAALDNGKAVLCEKPMAMNASEARRMRERAQKTGALNLIDHELRFLASRRKMRDMLLDDEIGEVRHAKFLFRSDSRADASRPWNWWSDETKGGGVLGAIGSHAVDSFRWLLGAEVSEVFGSLATHVAERPIARANDMRPVTSDDEALLILRFRDNDLTRGATATISMSMVEQGRAEHRVEIFGTRGAFAIEDSGQIWHAEIGAGEWKRIETERGRLAEGMRDSSWSRGFTAFAPRIVEALREGRSTVEGAAIFEDGYRTQLVLDAARRSNKTGCLSEVKESGTE
ncbi:MAG: hypothetical protein AUG51_24245 [Acidobacteria bacterium 13_1_20CM_3_53_8]|nr:MAG: hypothetical protein AUG51_24245 [Acidobacteria bacterium 13_1_20CM_3_53_8]